MSDATLARLRYDSQTIKTLPSPMAHATNNTQPSRKGASCDESMYGSEE